MVPFTPSNATDMTAAYIQQKVSAHDDGEGAGVLMSAQNVHTQGSLCRAQPSARPCVQQNERRAAVA